MRSYQWQNQTYLAALAQAGLVRLAVHPWLPDAATLAQFGPDFWAPWTANPLCAIITGHAATSHP